MENRHGEDMARSRKAEKAAAINLEIRKDDAVEVVAGEDKGKRGKVLKVFPRGRRVIVEGVNFIKRHTRPTQRDPQGGVQEREASVHISNVMLICPNCGHPTRIGHHFLEDGTRVRVCRKCNEMLENK